MSLHSINRESRLYVLREGAGFSCLGFEVAERDRRAALEWIGHEVEPMRLGTRRHFAAYRAAMAAASHHSDALRRRGAADWRAPFHLTPQLRGLEGARVAVIDREGREVRRFYVGRSGGWAPCHLEIHNRRSVGGPAAYLADDDTVRVVRRAGA